MAETTTSLNIAARDPKALGRAIFRALGQQQARGSEIIIAVHDRWGTRPTPRSETPHHEYWQLVLADGRMLVVFHDLIGGQWYRQMASQPREKAVPPQPVRGTGTGPEEDGATPR